jgi:ATP-dependent RNA helicase SUPV3L1/SUV3
VAVWADELRAARGVANPAAASQKPKVDPEVRAAANAAVQEAITKLEVQTSEGHGKASAGAAQALRHALKEFGKAIDSKIDGLAHAALAAAGELEGWQRWRADQLREELLIKAEGLLKRPEGQAIGGRKMQDMLRTMREQWKQTDQGGLPNHALWKRFDEACNEAYKVVEAWLEKIKADAIEHRKQRLALIEEVKAWAEANRTALDDDWKGFSRLLHQFGDRWRDAGHLGEKAFAELQPLWKAAISHAAEPLETMQSQSLKLRHAMIEEAKVLGEAAVLRLDAVKGLQQRWQAQAHAVPIDRRQEQKLWDAFRKPIDDAFQRKSAEREKAEASLGARDRVVLDASKALQAANAAADAQAIRTAMAALEAALHGQAQAQAVVQAAGAQEAQAGALVQAPLPAEAQETAADAATAVEPASDLLPEAAPEGAEVPTPPTPEKAAPKAPPKPVVAMRGDDRPGMKKEVPAADAGRFGKPGMRRDAGRSDSRPPRQDRNDRNDRPAFDPKNAPPRLGDAAFRAQREALDNAQFALKKLAAQAHGEALTQLLTAWETKNAAVVPSAQELGNRVNAATRTVWVAAIGGTVPAMAKPVSAQDALLRLEMAAEVPTPADHLDARRALQLQLLTRRNDPAPQQTWGHDAAVVLSSPYGAEDARRVQNTLKVLLKR